MLTFVRNEKLRPEAEAGCHDDTVIALAIAHYIRSVTCPPQRSPRPDRKDLRSMHEDEIEDYLEYYY